MSSPLENLTRVGSLAAESPDAEEFAGLVRGALARLRDAQNPANSLESRFDLAYNAVHGLCLASLRNRGYRPLKQRYVVFQAVPHTLGLGAIEVKFLSKAHHTRNLSEYEGDLSIDEPLVKELVALGERIAALVQGLPVI